MVDILLIESRGDDGILQEVMDCLSTRAQCRVTNLSVYSDSLSFHGLEIRPREQMVYLDGKMVAMTYHEFFTLLYLAQHPGWVFSKEQIYEAVYGETNIGKIDNNIYCLIKGIRNKIETDPQHPKYIQTVRGIGYKFIGKTEKPEM